MEDLRQPPHLCPVCVKRPKHLRKVSNEAFQKQEFMQEPVKEMLESCAKWKRAGVWAEYEAWLRTFPSGNGSACECKQLDG